MESPTWRQKLGLDPRRRYTPFMTRRELLKAMGAAALVRHIPLPVHGATAAPLKLAVITDLHHGLAPDAMVRLRTFVEAVQKRKGIDLVIQMGDFCYSTPESKECVDLFNTLPQPKIHVLGNHDMDKVDKDAAMKFWGMKKRYESRVVGGYRFVVLDLNHFKKEGKLVPYANGNYFTDNATHNWADPEQLDWLAKELRSSTEPVVLLSHQPLGFKPARKTFDSKGSHIGYEDFGPLPPEQAEVLKVVTDAAQVNPQGSVIVSLFGHLHVDRLEMHEEIPCYCVNSASYFWSGGMYAYSKPLFAFMEISPRKDPPPNNTGVLEIEGVLGDFVKSPPAESDRVVGRSASIAMRRCVLSKHL